MSRTVEPRRVVVIVTGGRDYADAQAVGRALTRIHGRDGRIVRLYHGDATGADALAAKWARVAGVPCEAFPYPSGSGKAGGPMRNRAMVAAAVAWAADACVGVGGVAFPGGRGTADCTAAMVAADIKVWRPCGAPGGAK